MTTKNNKQKSTLGGRIEEKMLEAGMNQHELAERAEVDPCAVGRYIKNTRSPQASVIARLARALNCSTDYLIGVGELADPKNEFAKLKNGIENGVCAMDTEQRLALINSLSRPLK